MSPSVAQSTTSTRGTAARLCLGCLGTKACWVCEGTGHAEAHTGRGVCPKCEGHRLCTYCPPVPAPRSSSVA